jgi:P-type E1-E2 ATPase
MMLQIAIPGRPPIAASYLVLDVNGTLTVDGKLLPGVAGRLRRLEESIETVLLTADTYGTAATVAEMVGGSLTILEPTQGAEQKLAVVRRLGPHSVIAIGNGQNDALMLEAAALGIGVVQAEGAAQAALAQADVVFTSITDALDALLTPTRLVATLRT